MSTQPVWTPMPEELQNLKPPTRADALAYRQRGWQMLPRFEDTAIGKQIAKGMYPQDKATQLAAEWDAKQEAATDDALRSCQAEYERKLERKAKIEANNAAVLEAETATLRQRYLEQPGATVEGFEKALPELMEERRRQAALDGMSQQERMAEHMRPFIRI